METELHALLTSSAAVTAHVPASRIIWGQLGQEQSLPAAVLNVISNADTLLQQGPDGLWQGRVRIDCYGATYSAALGLADAVIGVLHGHRGGGFQLVILDVQRNQNETGAADQPYRISIDFLTSWRAI